MRRLALANLVGNIVIVVTGGAVRLSGSGLGCPTWPRCTEDSYVTTREMGVHGVIEFGNRLLTFVLVMIAGAALLAAWRHARLRPLALAVVLGIPGQGVVGGITVLSDLNPYVVGLHFLLSIAIIGGSYALWQRTLPAAPGSAIAARLRPLTWAVVAASALALAVGVVVTGSGPHAGDELAHRTGLDPAMISQLHVDTVFLLLGLAVAVWFAGRAVASPLLTRRAAILLGVLLGQGAIGFVQYFTGLPEVLVGAHLLGACLLWTAVLGTVWATGFDAEQPAEGGAVTGSAPTVTSADSAPPLVTVR
ncbi:COX15/CtaA family protein [Catellatospora sp. KI3]|uniref:COX15/CtaA family protein n=1 Tax=Catellatospora sp. KI3 TaxID=3041620 RepID=UPI0024823293|nr:COX15/CtaA family protein [Catellatospora sp. KI3]MDI1465476.1 COX15/CtaA family protein [Catellatospora sp. KI3]